MESRKIAGWIVLTVLVVVAAVALAVTNLVTEAPIENRNNANANAALTALFPEAPSDGFEEVAVGQGDRLDKAYRVKQNDTMLGYAGVITAQGYAGPVEVTLGVNPDGSLRGISVGGGDFKETEGLGAKSKDPEFTDQFQNKTPPLNVGEDIDAIAGATVTSKAVTNAVNTAAEHLLSLDSAAAPQATGGMPASVANASVMSYAGPMLVNFRLDQSGAITQIEIGKERFMESEGYGSKVKDEGFWKQFIGKTPPLELGKDVEAVSGATGSSSAVVEAVNAAWSFAKDGQAK